MSIALYDSVNGTFPALALHDRDANEPIDDIMANRQHLRNSTASRPTGFNVQPTPSPPSNDDYRQFTYIDTHSNPSPPRRR